MGQVRPVRVIHFVAKGTIAEGRLSVLSFKRSLSGILDGDRGEISPGGSRLNRWKPAASRSLSRAWTG
jgi:hypothetical protein